MLLAIGGVDGGDDIAVLDVDGDLDWLGQHAAELRQSGLELAENSLYCRDTLIDLCRHRSSTNLLPSIYLSWTWKRPFFSYTGFISHRFFCY
ncbi:hypothetical protein VK98_21180 [Chromobacterium sp. LK11]|nr:hypothetical protein VK98_21180 [Chromobacterium sp. LK11]